MEWITQFDKLVEDYLPDLKMEKDVPMCQHTSFRIGGTAKRLAWPKNGEQLVLLMGFAEECEVEPLIIGKGTNVLIADEGVNRPVIITSDMKQMEWQEDGRITAEAGVSLAHLAEFACEHGLTGLEFAHGIPGTLGGAIRMNAGAYQGEMKDVVECVTILFSDGIRTLNGADMEFGYRHSLLDAHSDAVVLRATLKLTAGNPEVIRKEMQTLMERRRASQPLELPSAGSTFKRPEGYYAGTLIDECGLKGFRVGNAEVSRKHAGFIVNVGGATFADVTELIRQVQERVFAEKGVRLEPEVKIIQG